MNKNSMVISAVLALVLAAGCTPPTQAKWQGTQQFGSDGTDRVVGMTVAAGGSTILVGESGYAGAVWKRDANGTEKWSRLVNYSESSFIDVTTDDAGNLYAIGYFPSPSDPYDMDAHVIKYSPSGEQGWSVALGGASLDLGAGIALGSNDQLYVSGYTGSSFGGQTNAGDADVFVAQISTTGVVGWTRLLGDENSDYNYGGIAETSDGDILVVYQSASGSPTFGDITLAKLDTNGELVSGWPKVIQQGDGTETPFGHIAVDAQGNIYIGGSTNSTELFGEANSGTSSSDAFIMKVSGVDGTPIWGHLFGSSNGEGTFAGVALDPSGNVVFAGETGGALPGQLSAGGSDIFVAKWDSNGNPLWSNQFGSADADAGHAIAVDSQGQILVSGETSGDLDGNTNLGLEDAFLMKLDGTTGDVIPAPSP